MAGWMGWVLELFFISSLVAATSCLLAPLCVWGSVWLERALERKLINKQIQISSTNENLFGWQKQREIISSACEKDSRDCKGI